MKERPLSPKDFLHSLELAPRIALTLVILNKDGQLLLSRRAIEPCNGSWHLPGSFLDKNESFENCLERVTKEVGISLNPAKLRFLGIYNNRDGDERGHVVDGVFGVQIDSEQLLSNNPSKEAKEVGFFDLNALPGDIGFGHERTIKKVQQTIEAAGGRFEEAPFPSFRTFFHEF